MECAVGRKDRTFAKSHGPTIEGADAATGGDHQCAPHEVPGVQLALPVAVVGTVTHEAQINGCGAAASHAPRTRLHVHIFARIVLATRAAIVGEARREERIIEALRYD